MREMRGDLNGQGLCIGIVVSRFNEVVTHQLLKGALGGLADQGVAEEDVVVLWVPGSMELPVTATTLAQLGICQAVICLGAVIRGETSHYELVSGQAAAGIMSASVQTGVPIIFGVLTTEDIDQALNRSGGKMGNKGYDAALAAIEMARLLHDTRDMGSSPTAADLGSLVDAVPVGPQYATEPIVPQRLGQKWRWPFWKKN